jgi:hypothetical protein
MKKSIKVFAFLALSLCFGFSTFAQATFNIQCTGTSLSPVTLIVNYASIYAPYVPPPGVSPAPVVLNLQKTVTFTGSQTILIASTATQYTSYELTGLTVQYGSFLVQSKTLTASEINTILTSIGTNAFITSLFSGKSLYMGNYNSSPNTLYKFNIPF